MGRTPGAKNKEKPTLAELVPVPINYMDDSSMVTIHSIAEDQEIEGGEILQEIILPVETDSERVYEYCCTKCDISFKSKAEYLTHKCVVVYHVTCLETDPNANTTTHTVTTPTATTSTAGVSQDTSTQRIIYKKNEKNKSCFCCGENLILNHQAGSYPCGDEKCNSSFMTPEGLKLHVQNLHCSDETYACTKCHVKCLNSAIFDLHSETHKNSKPFKCVKCQQEFTRKYHLERHLSHTKCSDDKNRPELACNVCKRTFTRLDNLREHLRGHLGQNTRKREFQCPYCEKAFYGSSLLNIHIRTHTQEKPFKCDMCPKGFPSSGALTKHRRSHTGERPYECGICKNRFAAKETLNRHFKTHTGERKHVCNICGKSFIQATQLKSHMFYHTGENGFKCTQCDKVFNRRIRYTEHMQYVHEGVSPPSCDYCSKVFYRKEDLYRHMDTHVADRNHECSVCSKRFASKNAVKIHMRTHKAENPSVCGECGRTFIRFDCLVRHMRAKHRATLQKMINEAETKKIMRAQKRLNGLPVSDDEEDFNTIEIILLKEGETENEEAKDTSEAENPDDSNMFSNEELDSTAIRIIPAGEEEEEYYELLQVEDDDSEDTETILEIGKIDKNAPNNAFKISSVVGNATETHNEALTNVEHSKNVQAIVAETSSKKPSATVTSDVSSKAFPLTVESEIVVATTETNDDEKLLPEKTKSVDVPKTFKSKIITKLNLQAKKQSEEFKEPSIPSKPQKENQKKENVEKSEISSETNEKVTRSTDKSKGYEKPVSALAKVQLKSAEAKEIKPTEKTETPELPKRIVRKSERSPRKSQLSVKRTEIEILQEEPENESEIPVEKEVADNSKKSTKSLAEEEIKEKEKDLVTTIKKSPKNVRKIVKKPEASTKPTVLPIESEKVNRRSARTFSDSSIKSVLAEESAKEPEKELEAVKTTRTPKKRITKIQENLEKTEEPITTRKPLKRSLPTPIEESSDKPIITRKLQKRGVSAKIEENAENKNVEESKDQPLKGDHQENIDKAPSTSRNPQKKSSPGQIEEPKEKPSVATKLEDSEVPSVSTNPDKKLADEFLPIPKIVKKPLLSEKPKIPRKQSPNNKEKKSPTPPKKRGTKRQLDDDSTPIFLSDVALKKKISDLLQMLIDQSILDDLNFKKRPVEDVLCSVLEQLGKSPIKSDDAEFKGDDMTRMRENSKMLFTFALDEEHLKVLLNNNTVDEVITIILNLAN